METSYGWTIHGQLSHFREGYKISDEVQADSYSVHSNYLSKFSFVENNIQHIDIELFWNNELSGILTNIDESNPCDSGIMIDFENKLSKDHQGRYIVKFPWIKNLFLTSSYETEARFSPVSNRS